MPERSCNVVLVAEAPEALTEVCGISILERLLRTLQRLDVVTVTIMSATSDELRQHIAQPSWAREHLTIDLRARNPGPFRVEEVDAFESRTLIITAAYFDRRLLEALLTQDASTLLVDSDPAFRPLLSGRALTAMGYICDAALLQHGFVSVAAPEEPLFTEVVNAAERRAITLLDAAAQPRYVTSMRREIRPVWFPSPSLANTALAQRVIFDGAQNGTLDLPAIVHAPLETWIVARLCRTTITPNQITLFTAVVSVVVAELFASGDLGAGTLVALVVGVLDGLDGKQARVKVETTTLGQREHALDYILELSWWTALAFHFTRSDELPHAYALLLLLVSADLIDRAAKKQVKRKRGRNLDDLAPFDRAVRLIGARRNIYVWMFGAGVLVGAADKAFVWLCWWGFITAAVHVLRAACITRQHVAPRSKGTPH